LELIKATEDTELWKHVTANVVFMTWHLEDEEVLILITKL